MKRIKIIFFALSATALLGLGLAGYFSYKFYTASKDPQAAIKKETADIVEKASKLILLPAEETPTLATVADPEVLKDQAFFAQAQKGDKVLIYAQAKKAILYSVTLNKILEVAPLNIGDKTIQKPASAPAPVKAPTVSETKKAESPKNTSEDEN